MPTLNWEVFTGLPGGSERNFELLCRGIVRQNFGSLGTFRSLANQPGVEFHLKLDTRCDLLGDVGRWWGWQCKWYDLAPDGALGSTRRKKITEGLRKTEKYLPELTDWVLWTRRTLTKSDQDWFNGLSTRMKLHLWTGDDVNNLLSGQAAVLRSTYFGELVLTPEILRERHEQSAASVRGRWQPGAHHVGEAERELRRMLGDSESWKVLGDLSTELRTNADKVESSPAVPTLLAPSMTAVVNMSRQMAETLDRIADGIRSGDLDLLRDELAARQRKLPHDVATAPRRLRAGNQRAGLYATNAVAGCHDAVRALGEVEEGLASRLVALLAPAGCGKTHIAAQITAGTATRPHGILLHGRDLHATHTLDDLAHIVSIGTQPVPSMEVLFAAVDAAGQRAHRRLPVFIDGLNESEDPRRWKPLLSAMEASLAKYPYVLLVCTLRPEFVDDAIPDGTSSVEIKDYGNETIDAIREHFRYWKIDATDASLPDFLRHPLTLRLFCEVTNPTRQQVVGVTAMPGSLTTLFDRYLEQVGVRVGELAPLLHRFYAQDVSTAITTIANKLWETRSRSIEYKELRNLLGDAQRPWDRSLLRALEHEGVLLRMPSNGSDMFVPVYDLLGGHIIANSLLAKHGAITFETWAKEASTTSKFTGDYNVRHPLADDILQSLVGQVPRRFYSKQLWQLVEVSLRGRALRQTARLEPAFLDAATVDALFELVRAGDAEILRRCWQVRGISGHPLNAEGLDRALRMMTVADRDLCWTEWVRKTNDDMPGRGESVLSDLEYLDERWRAGRLRTGDRLRARWVMWTLTSTIRRLRDQATRALYWFGRFDPEGLFALTIDSLTVNDAYVGERMLAASYGVVMSHADVSADFAAFLKKFLEQLSAALVGVPASAPTHHYLTRLYMRGIVAFASKYYKSTLPEILHSTWAFAPPTSIKALFDGDPGADEAAQTLHMDFENYTLGRLFDDRDNYDMDHAGHKAAVAYVRGVVWELGWRASTFKELDSRIAEDGYHGWHSDRSLAERYGKKYSWIGFYSYAGMLEERGQFPRDYHGFADVDIDPSFPEKPHAEGTASVPETWLSPTIENHETWMRESSTSVPNNLLRRERIGADQGPWVVVHGFVKVEDRILGRKAWSFISAMVTPEESVSQLVASLDAGEWPWVARDIPSDYYTFAGEIPWHPNFASEALAENAYRGSVGSGMCPVEVEVLAHGYTWESYHSEMNCAGSTRVPSRPFSHRFDLHSKAQSFDQFLPDGSRATVTLSGIDDFEGELLYIREDLLHQYVDDRSIIWFAFGERELLPYPPSPPQWFIAVRQSDANSWRQVLTESDLWQLNTPSRSKEATKGQAKAAKKGPATKGTK